ncbi:CgeB family protein [Megalodesulfovibrio gigas]|uniref:Putative CgeB family protein n=1 Tax=Megalodesulfovibrio gigas (strain ATCC 19364 / DSM 1382 / NCIMB 9332 / VKM B-1759) TaxID=1121448 RepID=T2G639_MEGG1|nr:glycosyltransferase [Megalodesulfovibrio gigas]AGW12045.1 putative CgeB family protein [Megalodesulfovibrio gigas DSM 1382 = ATCC 19364]
MTTARIDLLQQDGQLQDVVITQEGRTRRMAGRQGREREAALVQDALPPARSLPVLLGAGLGAALEAVLQAHPGPVAVVDKEADILAATGLVAQYPQVAWVLDATPEAALASLTRWQMAHGGAPFHPIALPFYLRQDRSHYQVLADRLAASQVHNFWEKARQPRFRNWPPRILGVTSQYFLMGEVQAACTRLGVPLHCIHIEDQEIGAGRFMEELLTAVLEFKPDFLFTINHLGVDREGVLISLLEQMRLPMASWFVDNPHLILHLYQQVVHPLTAIFTWDRDNLPSLKALGFEHVHYLPLGTDAHRFRPGAPAWPGMPRAGASFVGNSMVFKVGHRLRKARPPRRLLLEYRNLAREFGASDCRGVLEFLQEQHPDRYADWQALPTAERRLALEAMLTWEATRQYRVACVAGILPLHPLICGDKGWPILFRHRPEPWTWHPELSYYDHLPAFYPAQAVNLNTTSKQMKGAVNQRVFDCPACGAFVLTDMREQLADLFEPGTEVAVYEHPDEVESLARHYLTHPAERLRIVAAARARVLAEHTYDRRILALCEQMQATFG